MKKLFWAFTLALTIALAACSKAPVTIQLTNPLTTTSGYQTIEVAWDTLTAKIAGLTPETVVVTDAKGVQIPSQVIFAGNAEPQLLIFQANLEGSKSEAFGVSKGVRETYKPLVNGRFVPERMDDYAWENNLVAFRTYGPALGKEFSASGIDYWAKSTPELIMDKWYKKELGGQGSYHLDTGEGCDCYKTGSALGCGASTPLFDNKLWYSHNFTTAERLDNGPIRTSVKLNYAPFKVGDKTVNRVKVISLDANTHFNKITDIYTGDFDTLTVAAGSVIHEGAQLFSGTNYDALYEPASDSKAGNDGFIGCAVILENGKPMQVDESQVRVATIQAGKPFVYYAGAATSKWEINTAEKWNELTKTVATQLSTPLQVTIK